MMMMMMWLSAANKTQSKFVEHHTCPMHDNSDALDADGLTALDLVDVDDSGTAADTRRRLRLPSDRQHYNSAPGKAASSPRRTERTRPDTVDGPAFTFLLLLVVASILLTMLVVGSLSYCAAVHSD